VAQVTKKKEGPLVSGTTWAHPYSAACAFIICHNFCNKLIQGQGLWLLYNIICSGDAHHTGRLNTMGM
jgi:hypothetical protein